MTDKYKMTFKIERLGYYLTVILKLLEAMPLKNWGVIVKLLVNRGVQRINFPKLGLKFNIDTFGDLLVLKEVVLDNIYGKIPQGARVMVDIGGGMGDLAIMAAKANSKLTVYTFEPDKHYFDLLKANAELNKVNNIRAFNQPAESLKDILKITKKRIDFMKLDCEGCEFDILKRTQEQYLPKVKMLVMEYHESGNNKIDDLQKRLAKAGFKVNIQPQPQVPGLGYLTASR